jgi:hypothetical protein
MVPPYCDQGRRPVEGRVHHPVRHLLLHNDVVQVEKRQSHLPVSYPGLLQEAAQQERRSLCG